ncbi:hypothetical protein [Xenorhabdus doucetiae]|nr:hypothetical protein [Xenorhabdus sp. 3]
MKTKISARNPCDERQREYNARRFAGRKHEKLRCKGCYKTSG